MKLHEAIGLELERREKILHESLECGHDLVEEQPCAQCRLEARIEALENAAIDAVQGYEAYAESGFEEVLDPPMMALAALLQEPTND